MTDIIKLNATTASSPPNSGIMPIPAASNSKLLEQVMPTLQVGSTYSALILDVKTANLQKNAIIYPLTPIVDEYQITLKINDQIILTKSQIPLLEGETILLKLINPGKIQLLLPAVSSEKSYPVMAFIKPFLVNQAPIEHLFKQLQQVHQEWIKPQYQLPGLKNLTQLVEQILKSALPAEKINTLNIKQAVLNSGVFFEARLFQQPEQTIQSPDLKQNLFRLLKEAAYVNQNFSNDANSSVILKYQAVKAISQFLAGFLPIQKQHALEESALEESVLAPNRIHPNLSFFTPPPAAFQIRPAQNNWMDQTLLYLIKQITQSIAKITLNQLTSLSRSTQDSDPIQSLYLDLPIQHKDQVHVFHVLIAREEVPVQEKEPEEKSKKNHAPEKIWRLTLSFDIDPLGPIYVKCALIRNEVSLNFFAENKSTVELTNGSLRSFVDTLNACGLKVKSAHCQAGKPSLDDFHFEQSFVDIRT